jgi:hypothetical protein
MHYLSRISLKIEAFGCGGGGGGGGGNLHRCDSH